MFKKYIIKTEKNLRDYRFSRIYLLLIIAVINIYFLATALIFKPNYIAGVVMAFFLAIFLFSNTRKKLNAQQLDHGIMIKPFEGMLVSELLNGPDSIVQKSNIVPSAPVSLINWLYFCIYAITQSSEMQFHYHQHLITTVNADFPELLPWIPELYKALNSTPPIPKDITIEDFNES